jgi:general secretion pathway protein D
MMKPPLAATIATLLSAVIVTPVSFVPSAFAGDTGYARRTTSASTEEREIARRQDYLNRGIAALHAGEKAMEDHDYEKAFAQLRLACDLIPNAPAYSRLYVRALTAFCDAGVELAKQRIAEGRYADADAVLHIVVDERYDPNCGPALKVLKNLETPDYYNKTISPKFRANVEQVKQWFVDAKGYYDTGRYDLAYKRCDQILNVDRYNIAARKLQEQVNKKRYEYAVQGYDHTRSFRMWQLENAWDTPVRKFSDKAGTGIILTEPQNTGMTQKLQRKLETIIIPKLEFRDATIREAIDFLKQKSTTLDPAKEGVNIVLRLDTGTGGGGGGALPPPAAAAPAAPVIPGLDPIPGAAPAPAAGGGAPILAGGNPEEARITVSLNNIPLGEALRYVTGLANLKFKVESYAVAVVPQSMPTDVLVTKEWKVQPGFLAGQPTAGGGGDPLAAAPAKGGGGSDLTKGGGGIVRRIEAKDYLTAAGVTFPPGSSAIFLPSSSRLIVKDTQENLDLVDAIVEQQSMNGPVQVEIEAKFVEITQTNLKELSFDLLVGPGNIPNHQSVFFSGGTQGTSPTLSPSDFPILGPGGQPIASTNGTGNINGSLRSGSLAISQNAIDALLFGVTGNSALAPAVGALSGVFTDPQFQLVIRALNQKKGVDLLSAPRVTTKSGQRAQIEIIREFRYPTEFEPPQIPQTFGNTGNNGGGGGTSLISVAPSSFPVTPTTPTSFETRNTGVTLEVEPVVGPDGFTIDLNLVPQVVEFEGFINYGSPIQTTATNPLTGVSTTNVITPNIINQPIFSTRKVQTSVTVFDGQTVVLGGLIREDVQKTEDKIPLLGDIPIIGRLFRSQTEQHVKRNLVIFVSARLINPAGEPVHPDEETEEVVETLPVPEAVSSPELPLMGKDMPGGK